MLKLWRDFAAAARKQSLDRSFRDVRLDESYRTVTHRRQEAVGPVAYQRSLKKTQRRTAVE